VPTDDEGRFELDCLPREGGIVGLIEHNRSMPVSTVRADHEPIVLVKK